MDNDVQGTEYCIGFSSAVTRGKELINRQRTSLGSHERIGVFRIFGRGSGFTALYTAYVTSARCVIPEAPFDLDHLIEILVEDKRLNPSRYSFVIASEGAMWQGGTLGEYGEADAYGHRHKVDVGFALAEKIKERTGEEAVNSELTYDLRSGEADSLDQMVAITFANIAVDLIRDDAAAGRMIAIVDGKYAFVDIPEPGNPRTVEVATMYDLDRFRPQYHNRLGKPMMLASQIGDAVLAG
jgi:6-phosphofructokinase 1